MKIVGIHDGHNASVCLLEDGHIRSALQEERLARIKNFMGFPSRALKATLKSAGLSFEDVDLIAMHSKHMPKIINREQLLQEYRHSGSIDMYLRRFVKGIVKKTFLKEMYLESRRRERVQEILKQGFKYEKIIFVDHHLAHAAAAYYGSPWRGEEEVLVLTNDAGGDELCATVNIGRNDSIERIAEIPVSHSVGYIYSMLTFILGMVPEEHEYKVMGMAPYVSEGYVERFNRVLEKLVEFDESTGGLTWYRTNGCPHTQFSYRFFRRLTELQRFDAICGGLQRFLEDFLLTWVRNCIRKTGIRKLALSGGVFMNVKANMRILELPEVDSLFVCPSCGDESNAFGAAYQVYAEALSKKDEKVTISPLRDLYWGLEYKEEEIEDLLKQEHLHYERKDDIEKEIALLLSRGEIVARLKGRMEFGARALGNRSILADPRNAGVIRIINEMIKNRDFWMPFAPSILKEREKDYVVNPKAMKAPYMIICFDATNEVDHLKAACHPYDKTIRPQIVEEDWAPDYARLIKQFEKITGVGAVLNTSFNLHGYPIVCSPEDAIDVFLKSGLQYLALENFLVRK
jgi:carbamoyltransferase